MSKKIFISGIAGHLGRALAKMLSEKGYEVLGNDILSRENARFVLDFSKITYLWKGSEDLELEDLAGVDIVINCAAQADRPMGITSPFYTIYDNLMPLVHLLELCRKIKIEKFLHPGSGTTYIGMPEELLPATEKTTPEPKNPYSASKYCQDIICQCYRFCHGVPVVTMRSGMVVGVPMRLDIVIPIWIMRALKNEPILVYGANVSRTPTDSRDVMKYWLAIVEAEPSKVVGKIFHTVFPTNKDQKAEYTLLEMAEMVRRITNSVSEIKILEPAKGELVNGKEAREWIISTTAEELGVKPEFTLEQSIIDITEWIKKVYDYKNKN